MWIKDTKGNLVNLQRMSFIRCSPPDPDGLVAVLAGELSTSTVPIWTGQEKDARAFIDKIHALLISYGQGVLVVSGTGRTP